ncbi:YceI family protein [Pedobacter fastidiosus]|uniref:Polyisoprenoid-binding protein n=1 Tax=Pedobacter fastidiosus TaxID=2765361 RepID=A0ABR7KSU8_9SPHI|nr:YceI family protein [Pedobacter fastidiosus]MBC6110915.1 polyisoprenoid-binding protein [Pedobacter fastidiosus]
MTNHWKIDPSHSEVEFKVKHLMITTITGHFGTYKLDVTTNDDDFTSATEIDFTINVNSINTKNQQRDEHLKSAEFFDIEHYPEITLRGGRLEKKNDLYILLGELTIKGISREITFEVEFGGQITDPYGQQKAGFTIIGAISRKEFGLIWNAITEAGQVVVGDLIRINCNIQLIKTEF